MARKARGSNAPTATSTITLTPPVAETLTPEQIKDQQDETKAQQRLALAQADDKIGQVEDIEFAPCAFNQSPAQCFGSQVVVDCGGTDTLPDYIFHRWYFGKKIIVDTFYTEAAYESADVEGRRAMAHKYGYRYAAMGPNQSRYPLADKKLRAKYPSLVEQLHE